MPRKKGIRQDYLDLSKFAKEYDHSNTINEIKNYFGYIYDKDEMDYLALYLQICVKKSRPMYLHGYVLTSALYKYINDNPMDYYTILETGTARGFSSICMGKILHENNKKGVVHTIDILSHRKTMYWNCILDEDGMQTRHELLHRWKNIRDNHIMFHAGDSKVILTELDLKRINFAFLDARHNYDYVKMELDYVKTKQESGDVIVCDDYTTPQYTGIIKAIDEFLEEGLYEHKIFYGNDGTKNRGYVYMKKK
jgi:hypothetical protein